MCEKVTIIEGVKGHNFEMCKKDAILKYVERTSFKMCNNGHNAQFLQKDTISSFGRTQWQFSLAV